MTFDQFRQVGEGLRNKYNIGKIHGYFQLHAPRLHQTCEVFDLFSKPLGDVLEIGPFYGYTPFILRQRCLSYSVFEGDDPVVSALEPIYKEHLVTFARVDFFEVFGPLQHATHRLPVADATFDTILCWETMEHFNFNPVKFVRELHRILRPGGRVCITAPNKASWQSVAALFSGKGEKELINNYYDFENYQINGKTGFYGFHWREYTFPELTHLFARAGFKVERAGSFNSFQPREKMSVSRRIARGFAKATTSVFSRHGTHVYLMATK
jgi:SAM-dependent methyltransferase